MDNRIFTIKIQCVIRFDRKIRRAILLKLTIVFLKIDKKSLKDKWTLSKWQCRAKSRLSRFVSKKKKPQKGKNVLVQFHLISRFNSLTNCGILSFVLCLSRNCMVTYRIEFRDEMKLS